ncbi:histone-lysine N-methyltransferase ASHR1 isoform X2 [Solenopsis invicta]|uniref:histone-lysine N-methyltransferase ASHR1 isoform X2 n=1 Tax=Solenopsis invicta TaxID=13686 RepID=UPI00193D1175|nr:histone-lysine N-methyltransferase ASHR1 isoform X2 [Solenopsis invicta]
MSNMSKMSNGNIVKKGTTILTDRPFVFVLRSAYRTTRCDNCFKSEKLLRCSSCQYVYYCNRKCQKQSWRIHKLECVCLKKTLPGMLPDSVRLVARIIIKLKQGGANEMDYYTKKNYRKFADLSSHYSDMKVDAKHMPPFIALCAILIEFLDETLMPSIAELISIYGKMNTNRLEIQDELLKVVGFGIYLGASVVGHSCKPNAVATFEGTTVIIRTLTDLPCLDWSQIKISYIDLIQSKKDRREKLYNSYHFWCDCERCKEEESLTEAAACPNSSCDSPCSIDADKCEKCNTKISVKFKETFQEIVDFTNHDFENIIFIAFLRDLNTFSWIKRFLEKQKNVMYKFNVHHICTLEKIYIASVNLEYWKEVEFYSKQLEAGYLFYYGEAYPQLGMLYLTLGSALLNLGKPREALRTLNKANTVLMITHGNKHLLVREVLKPLLCNAILLSRFSS